MTSVDVWQLNLKLARPVECASHLPLRVVRLAVRRLLSLLLLLRGAVMAVEAAGGGAEHAVMAGNMAGDAADDGALDAALGVGGRHRRQRERGDGNSGECGFHDAYLRMKSRIPNRAPPPAVPSRAFASSAAAAGVIRGNHDA